MALFSKSQGLLVKFLIIWAIKKPICLTFCIADIYWGDIVEVDFKLWEEKLKSDRLVLF